MGGGFAEGGASESTAGAEAESNGSSGSPASTSSDTGEDGSTNGGTFEPSDESSSGNADEGSTGDASTGTPADDGTEDPGGAYAPCDTNDDCALEPAGLACLHAEENGAGGFCSPACGTYGATPPDANLCPDTPAGVSATVVCLEGLVRNCALSCQQDADCPQGTACLMANNGNGPYCFGL
jgi:hypothetical protein